MLHYLPIAQQVSLLSRLKTSVIPGGVLVVRDCLRDNGTRFCCLFRCRYAHELDDEGARTDQSYMIDSMRKKTGNAGIRGK